MIVALPGLFSYLFFFFFFFFNIERCYELKLDIFVFLLTVTRRFLCCSSFFVCAFVVSYVAFVLYLFVPNLYFLWCFGKAVLTDCNIFWLYSSVFFFSCIKKSSTDKMLIGDYKKDLYWNICFALFPMSHLKHSFKQYNSHDYYYYYQHDSENKYNTLNIYYTKLRN